MKQTQLDKVKAYIKDHGMVYTWDIESFAANNGMMASSALRYARTLCRQGYIEHFNGLSGLNKHRYVWIRKEAETLKTGTSEQSVAISEKDKSEQLELCTK